MTTTTPSFARPSASSSACAALLALLCPPGLCSAGEVLVYGGAAPGPAQAERALAALTAGGGPASPTGGVSHVLDLPFPTDESVWMAGDLLALPCSDPSLASLDPSALLAEATAAVDELSFDKAQLLLDRAVRALPCASAAVSRETLTGLHYVHGIAEFMTGAREAALRAFREALAIDLDLRWNPDYPPEPQQAFLEATKDVVTAGTASLGVDLRGGEIKGLRVDGVAYDPLKPHTIALRPGRHLVAVEAADTASARLVGVGAGGGALVTRASLRDAVLSLAWEGIAAEAARSALVELASTRDAETVYVVALAVEGARAYQFRAKDRSVVPLAVPDGFASNSSSTSTVPASSEGGHLGIALGGGVFAPGTSDAPYGAFGLRLHARPIGPLEIGFVAQDAVRSFTDDAGSYAIHLLAFGGDLRARLPLGHVHPFGGFRGVAGPTRIGADLHPWVALGGVGGVELTSGDDRGLLVLIEGSGGYFGSPRGPSGFGGFSAGAGARF